jgi:hypothetical protein
MIMCLVLVAAWTLGAGLVLVCDEDPCNDQESIIQ